MRAKLSFQINSRSRKDLNSLSSEDLLDSQAEDLAPKASGSESKPQNGGEFSLAEDDPIFDYDAAYDEIKAQEMIKKKLRNDPNNTGVLQPRYVNSIFRATARRKLELQRAEIRNAERKSREMKSEGSVTEFFTASYKKKLREVELLEEEEKLEELKNSPNMSLFYKEVLAKKTSAPKIEPIIKIPSRPSKREIPSHVVLNDSREIVDKTQLLKGGLNVRGQSLKERSLEERSLKEQILKEQRAKARAFSHKCSQKDIQSAKERYLARKLARNNHSDSPES